MRASTRGTANDSDVYKVIEGAAYCLQNQPDAELEAYVDRLIDRIAASQQPDGYLNTNFVLKEPDKKWYNMRMWHELYCAGHFFEAAAEYYQVTGKRKVLDTAVKLADHIDSVFGPGKRYDVGGHEEIELALIKLYRVTKEERYLDLSKFFCDERGHAHGTERKPFDPKDRSYYEGKFPEVPDRAKHRLIRNGRMQDHKPLVQQTEAIGHAVRAGYIYSAMADIAAITGDADYHRAVKLLWEDVVTKKLYLTGAVGTAQYGDEGFGDGYKLPNRGAYCETCAAVAFIFWNHRMNLLTGQAKYCDVLELTLYNGFLGSVSLSGDKFFYINPLASGGKNRRSGWYNPACCPSNVVRLFPQIGRFAYAIDRNGVYVNLYVGSACRFAVGGTTVKLCQSTRYPWDGNVTVTLEPEAQAEFSVRLRIPQLVRGRPVPSDLYRFDKTTEKQSWLLKVNGQSFQAPTVRNGYAVVKRIWKKGDRIELVFPMPVRRVYAHPDVDADRGRVALMRGPLVYCLEEEDHETDVLNIAISKNMELAAEYAGELLGGLVVLRGHTSAIEQSPMEITAIPYYAWNNRSAGKMAVWLREKDTEGPKESRKPVKVFLLAGQSNMEGQGVVSMDHPHYYNSGKGNLVNTMKDPKKAHWYQHLKDGGGKWVVRDDVKITFRDRSGGLTVGYTGYGGSSHIGPELQFGHVVGDYFEEPVLLIKTAWGGKSLFKDFRPPSSGGTVGSYYRLMLQEIHSAIDSMDDVFPDLAGRGYEMAGFVWMQGWNDMCDPQAIPEYDKNLVNLVKDLRSEFQSPELPVVIGELGNGGPEARGNMAAFRAAQKRGAEQIDNAAFVITHNFWRDPQQSPNVNHGHHWCGNAESYFLIGDVLGKAAIELIESASPKNDEVHSTIGGNLKNARPL